MAVWHNQRNFAEVHAVEGDVLYAAPMTWHKMAAEAPTGPRSAWVLAPISASNFGDFCGQQECRSLLRGSSRALRCPIGTGANT
jgi:hypothetical protein